MRKAYPTIRNLCLPLSHAVADATIAYTYDAKGSLVRAASWGGLNNGPITTYDYDKADSLKIIKTTGAPR